MTTLHPDVPPSSYCQSRATISECGQYRYTLVREWRSWKSAQWDMWKDEADQPVLDGDGAQLGEPKPCVFVMLNPSTADGNQDDPTIRRCVAFAKAWGYDRLEVVNLFAYRATDPKDLFAISAAGDPIGPDNQRAVEDACWDAGIVVCAWGAHGGYIDQDETVLGWIEGAGATPYALKLTKDGYPSHPLYLKGDLQPFPYRGRK